MAITTFEAFVELANQGMICIADIAASEHLTAWTATAGRTITWECTPEQRLSIHGPKEYTRVLVDDDELESQASVALVDANPGSFYWSGTKLYVSMVDSSEIWYHTIYAGFTLYVCSGSYQIGRPVYLNGHLYWPYLGDVETIHRSIADIYHPNVITTGTTVKLFCGTNWDAVFELYRWTNQDVEVRVGGEALTFNEYARVFTGIIRKQNWKEGVITLEVTDNSRELDRAFPSRYISADDCTKSYNFLYPMFNSGVWNVAPVDVNADCADEDAAIGAAWPYLIGRSVAVVPHMLAYNGLSQMVVYGEGVSYIESITHEVNNQPGVFATVYADGSQGTTPAWMLDAVDGVVYDTHGNQKGRYAVCNGPILSGHADFPGGAVIENPADVIQHLLQTAAGIATPWNETERLKSRFLLSLMPIQIHVTTAATSRALETSTKRAIPVVIPPDLTSTPAKPPTLLEICNRICLSTGSVLFTNNSGEYVFRTLRPDASDAKVLDEAEGSFVSIEADVNEMAVYPKVNVGFGALTLAARTLQMSEFVISESIPENHAEVTTDKPLTINDTYLADEAGARCLANRIARWGCNQPINFKITTTFRHLDIEIGDTVRLDRSILPRADSSIPVYAVVTGVGIEIKTGRIQLDAVRQFKNRQALIGPPDSPDWATATAAEKRASGFYGDDPGLVVDGDNASLKASLNW